jgi:hypothetical protein
MARVVGARAADLERIGRAMGLGPPPKLSREQQTRAYITVIKRNWHLLPYPQLLELLGWTADQMAYSLREDDFLFSKLGGLKPRCPPLRYQPPDEPALDRERELARIVHEHFPAGVCSTREPLFAFVTELSRPLAPRPGKPSSTLPESQALRFCYSYFAPCGDPLMNIALDPYPDGYLARLAQSGVNGVWLQAVLYKLAPFPWDPGLSASYQVRLSNLRALVARAAKHHIRVFLYLNEPRAMPVQFFESLPALKGVVEGDHAALCTSQPEVQSYLSQSVASICRAVPRLGGFFSITASENLTNCWSHGTGKQCPRCRLRSPAEVIAEVNRVFVEGIRQAQTSARLIAWDWGWNDSWAEDAIRQLPHEASLMSVSEWDLPINRGGIPSKVEEYSISAVGPGPRAQRHRQVARECGLEAIAKIQAGNTWELSAVPAIPAVENVARHAENLGRAGVSGLMLGWTLGGYPSVNLEVVAETLAGGSASAAMQRVAQNRFGQTLAPAMVAAWQNLSLAFSEFPFHIFVNYFAPQQLGPANLLWPEATGYAASMVGFPYDDLDGWRAIYPPEVFVEQFDLVAEGFERALRQLRVQIESLRAKALPADLRAVELESGVAEAAQIHFRSVANQARFILSRRAAQTAKPGLELASHSDVLEATLEEELGLARRLHQLQSTDMRIGFEASNQYYYVPVDLAEKVLNCEYLLERWLPKLREPPK